VRLSKEREAVARRVANTPGALVIDKLLVAELLAELDIVRGQRDEEAKESARYLHDITKLKARYVTLLEAATDAVDRIPRSDRSALEQAIQAAERDGEKA
jgi:hypothetical protein